MPGAEVEIDEPLVRALLTDQHPDLADRPLALVQFGWDNVIFRLGPDLAVRLPRRAAAAGLIEHEQRWLPTLAPRLPLAVPTPVRVGRPAAGYPWSWSIMPWLEGSVAASSTLADPDDAARALGDFQRCLHEPAPGDAPVNSHRGGPLADRAEVTAERFVELSDHVPALGAPAVRRAWDDAVAGPAWSGPPLWLHGDLHPANVLVRDGSVTAVIDFGDITGGDPATDLSIAWMLLPAAARPILREAAGDVDDDTWNRARAWALSLALAYLANSADSPLINAIGRRTIDAVAQEVTARRPDGPGTP